MTKDALGVKNTKDPLKIDFKETTKDILKGAIVLAIGIPLLTGLADLINGN